MDKEGPWGVYFRNAEPGEAIELVVWDGVGHRIKKLSRKQAVNTLMNLANTMASQQLLEEEAPPAKSIADKIYDAKTPEDWTYDYIGVGKFGGRSFVDGAWRSTFSDKHWDEAHVANGVFDTTAVYESDKAVDTLEHSVKTQLGTCCTAMVGPGRGEILSPDYSGPDRRVELDDRRVNRSFTSDCPNRRSTKFVDDGWRWGRRVTDPQGFVG